MTGKFESVFSPELFAGQRILVTGGGSGMGRCIAHELATLGATVLVVGRTESKLEQVCSEIIEDGGAAEFASCDVRDTTGVQEMVADFLAKGQIAGLVNCAGGQFPALLEETSTNGFEAVVRNNLTSTFVVSKAVYLQCMKQHGGAIVNITADEVGGMPFMGHSGAARAGVGNLTATAALEWASYGVRVNAVAPGYIATSGFDTYTDERMISALKRLQHYAPLARLGTEAEISATVCFLLSPAGYYITGQVLRVDGGSSLNVETPMFERPPMLRNPVLNGFHRSIAPDVLADDPAGS